MKLRPVSARPGPAGLRRRDLLVAGLPGATALACPTPARARSVAPDRMADTVLRTCDGRPVRWRSDVLRDRVAVVNFVFTTCSSLCPTASAQMAALQAHLTAERAGGVVLVSISLDPLTDTPERLARYARAFAPGPDWWWLTGEPRAVFGLLDALGVEAGGDPQDHAPVWLVGGVGRGAWRRVLGVPSPRELRDAVRSL